MNKKIFIYGAMALMVLSSCRTKKEAYQAAYEVAKAKEEVKQEEVKQTYTEQPAEVVRDVQPSVRKEKVTTVNASDANRLKTYGVVVGSFSIKTNAESLVATLKKDGYAPVMVQNENNFYRVIIDSFDTKAEAATKRDQVKSKFAPRFSDSWLLERVK